VLLHAGKLERGYQRCTASAYSFYSIRIAGISDYFGALNPLKIAPMRIRLLLLLLVISAASQAQNVSADVDSLKHLLDIREPKKALPYFKSVMASSDMDLKQKMVNYVAEGWTSSDNGIPLSGVATEYGNVMIEFMNANFGGKKIADGKDQYTIGMIHLAYAYSGANSHLEKALNFLGLATRNNYPNASYQLAHAVLMKKRSDPAISWNDVMEIYAYASAEKKDPMPLIELARSYIYDYTTPYGNDSKETRDTAKMIALSAFEVAKNAVPDSFYRLVNYFWSDALGFNRQDEKKVDLLNYYFATTQYVDHPGITRAYAFHYLYKYFYEHNHSKSPEARKPLMDTLRMLYKNNDAELVSTFSFFINRAKPNNLSKALSINSGWLRGIAPVTLSNSYEFYTAAAATEQDFLPFISKNGINAAAVAGIETAYRKRFNQLFDLLADNEIFSKEIMAISKLGASVNAGVLSQALRLPAFSSSSKMKHALADYTILINLLDFYLGNTVPMELKSLPAVFAGWSATDKAGYDLQYLEYFLKTVGGEIQRSLSREQLAKAGGKTTMDLNDYAGAMKVIEALVKIWE